MGENTTFTRVYCNRVSFHLWLVVVVVVVAVVVVVVLEVVVVVVCSELTWPQIGRVFANLWLVWCFNNANVTWVKIQVLMDFTIITTCGLLPQS